MFIGLVLGLGILLYLMDIMQEAEEEKVPTTLTETRRLALVNMDWDHLKVSS
jgi:hypothetical protein